MQKISATLWDQVIKSRDKTLFLSEDLTATIWQKNCTNVDFTNFQLPLDHFILGTNRKWPPFFDWKCGGWKLHLLCEIFFIQQWQFNFVTFWSFVFFFADLSFDSIDLRVSYMLLDKIYKAFKSVLIRNFLTCKFFIF